MADKVALQTNIPATIQFLRDDCRFSSHPQYGDSFSHYVNAAYPDGTRIERGTMRATPKLHDALLQAGCGKMAVADITKKEIPGNKIEWQVVLRRHPEYPGFAIKPWEEGGPVPGQTPAPASAPAPVGSTNPTPPAISPPAPLPFVEPPTVTLADLTRLYEECLIAAQMTVSRTLGEVEVEIVKDIATTFFIEANRRKLPIPPATLPTPPNDGFDEHDLPPQQPAVNEDADASLPF